MFFFHSHVCNTSLTNLHCICKITYKILDKHESVRYNNSTLKNNIAGWSSSVARRAHNPKAVGSNPAPATKLQSTEISVLFLYLDKGKFNRNKKAQCCETLFLYPSILLDLILCLIANIKMQWHSPFLNRKNQ